MLTTVSVVQAQQLLMYRKRMQINFLLSSDGFLHVQHDNHTSMCCGTVHPLFAPTPILCHRMYRSVLDISTHSLLSGNASSTVCPIGQSCASSQSDPG